MMQEVVMMEQRVMHEVRDLMIGNWLPVAFSTRMVEPEKLLCVLEGASWTPSHLNLQPWNFIIATRDDSIEYERLVSCLAETSVESARRAPVLMLSVVRLSSSSNGERNVHAFRDSRHAMSNLVLRARMMGLVAQPISGFNTTKVREQFQIPAGFEPTTGIALGYPTDVKGWSVDPREEVIGSGRPVESFVFTGSWGRPSPLTNQPVVKERHTESPCRETSGRYSGAA
jgi:nitroreductase